MQPKRHRVGDPLPHMHKALVGQGRRWADVITSIRRDLLMIAKDIESGHIYVPAALFNMTKDLNESAYFVWDAFATFFEVAVPQVDWSKPFHIRPGEAYQFRDFDDFYEQMCAPALGPYDHLVETLGKFRSRTITAEEGAAVVRTAAARVQAAAGRTTGEVRGRGRISEDNAQIAHLPQPARAAQNGTSRRTQQKLDALARRAPDLLEKVKAGELSAHAAAKEAGIVKGRTALDDLKRAWTKATESERMEFRNIIEGEES